MLDIQKRIKALMKERENAADPEFQQTFADAIASLSNIQTGLSTLEQTRAEFSKTLTDLWSETKALLDRADERKEKLGDQVANNDESLKLVVITTPGSLETIKNFARLPTLSKSCSSIFWTTDYSPRSNHIKRPRPRSKPSSCYGQWLRH
jgi:septal ring factor EnvC (AmiA/AmiB activator)